MKISTLLRLLDRKGFRWLLKVLVFGIYKIKGATVKSIAHNNNLNLWEYQIGNSFFVTETPSWFSSDSYYLQTLKKYSCNFYLPQSGDVVIDIGAGVGEELLPFSSQVGSSGHVYALEANPRTFSVLEYVFSKNRITNASIYNLAISSKHETLSIEDDGGYGVKNSILSIKSAKKFEVEAMNLDEFIHITKIERIDFLKVNIEGAERLLIQGMGESLSIIKHFAIACHDFRSDAGESEFFKTHQLIIDFFGGQFDLSFQQSNDVVRDNYVYGTNKKILNK
jgi:FkbM family methyltransferase